MDLNFCLVGMYMELRIPQCIKEFATPSLARNLSTSGGGRHICILNKQINKYICRYIYIYIYIYIQICTFAHTDAHVYGCRGRGECHPSFARRFLFAGRSSKAGVVSCSGARRTRGLAWAELNLIWPCLVWRRLGEL